MLSKTSDATRPDSAAADGAAEDGLRNVRWSAAFVDALVAAGVRDAVVAPGSRSAPLAVALERSGLRIHIAIDERAGAYFALGLAKASRTPVAVVTTSGTAAVNLHPAAVEALHGRVPLLLLTADRPPELRDTGAPQTIDQIELFGSAVRWFCEVGAPSPGDEALRYVASLGTRAARVAGGPPAGPVHLNFAFREPLLPDPASIARALPRRGAPPRPNETMAPESGPEASAQTASAVRRAAPLVRARKRGLIVCGPDDADPGFAEAVADLARVTGYPVLADPLSSLRYGPHDRSAILGAYDLFLRAPRFAARQEPEIILQFGASLTSKSYHGYAAQHANVVRVAVDPAGAWRDPSRRLRDVFPAPAAPFAAALAEALRKEAEPLASWCAEFSRAEAAARAALEHHVAGNAALGEESVFPALFGALPEGATLYVGNSMVVRDLDSTAPGGPTRVRVLGNRGVNGIDGVVSSALGASAASEEPLLAVVGDLSFHHDLNGLAALREGRARATVVVVNNDGGGIFSFLPLADHAEVFERLFGTPHGLDIERVAALYDIPYVRAATTDALRTLATASLRARATTILEVRTERRANRAAHRALADAVVRAVEAGA
jgi:2-succinyl-5-enolpyruvyl-6-hydroxy-3-cyclohexene-1-carboxylate synthase